MYALNYFFFGKYLESSLCILVYAVSEVGRGFYCTVYELGSREGFYAVSEVGRGKYSSYAPSNKVSSSSIQLCRVSFTCQPAGEQLSYWVSFSYFSSNLMQ